MSLFELKITSAQASCNSPDYFFRSAASHEQMREGDTVTIAVEGGEADYTWESQTPGVSVTNATTTIKSNTITCNYFPVMPNNRAVIKVTDSCGNVIFCYIALVDDIEEGCIGGACAVASSPVLSGPTTGVTTGSQFTVTGGQSPYRWRGYGLAIDSAGLVQGVVDVDGDNYQASVVVIDLCGRRDSLNVERDLSGVPITFTPWVADVGETVLAYGCDDDMRYSIDCGEIDKRTGEITSTDGCECFENITVTAADACGQSDVDSKTNPNYSLLTLNGSDEPSVNDVYTPVGGVAPYNFSFDGGTIDSSGTITAITSCGGSSGNGAVGSVSVTDACGQVASITVRLTGGAWVFDYQDTSPCDQPFDSHYLYKDEQVSGNTKAVVTFQHDDPGSYASCSGCTTLCGWLCRSGVTGEEYFGISGMGTIQYKKIYPTKCDHYNWEC